MSQQIKILELIARLNIGGPAVLVIDLAAGLNRNEFQVEVAAGQVGPGEGQMDFWAEARNVEWSRLAGLSPQLGQGNWKAFREIKRHLKDRSPDILHTHTAKAGALGRLAARRGGPKRVHTYHGHVFSGYFPPFKTRLFLMVERFLARKTDRIVVLSPEQADEISRTYRVCPAEKIVIIPVGLDLEPFVRAKPEGLRKSLGISPNIFLVGFVGRLTKIKRTSVLLQALAGLKSQLDQPLALVIVGQGELQPELESEAASLGIAEQVHFVGWQERMPGIYASLDALVLPSANEGLPLVLIEALAAGRPVAATPVGGVPGLLGLNGRPERGDFIKGLRGLSFLPDDPAGLAKALGWVARQNEAALELTAAGQRYVIENHSKEVSLAAHAELYRSLAEARR